MNAGFYEMQLPINLSLQSLPPGIIY